MLTDFLLGPLVFSVSTSCIRLSTSWQRSKGKNDDVSSAQSCLNPLSRRSRGRRGMFNLQLFAVTASNSSALHSSTWYSCKNSLPSPVLKWERQCPPLFYRHILWSQLPHQPHNPSHVSVMHIWPLLSAWPLAQLRLFLSVLVTNWFFPV